MNSAAIKWLLLVHENRSCACSTLQNEARDDTGVAGGQRSSRGKTAGTAEKVPEEEGGEENCNQDTFGNAAAPPTESWGNASREELAIRVAAAVSEQLLRDFSPAVCAALAGIRRKRCSRPFLRLPNSGRSDAAASSANGSSSRRRRQVAQRPEDRTTDDGSDRRDLDEGGCRPPVEPKPCPGEPGDGRAHEDACQGAASSDNVLNSSGTTPPSASQAAPRYIELEGNSCSGVGTRPRTQSVEVCSSGEVSISVSAALVSVVVERNPNPTRRALPGTPPVPLADRANQQPVGRGGWAFQGEELQGHPGLRAAPPAQEPEPAHPSPLAAGTLPAMPRSLSDGLRRVEGGQWPGGEDAAAGLAGMARWSRSQSTPGPEPFLQVGETVQQQELAQLGGSADGNPLPEAREGKMPC